MAVETSLEWEVIKDLGLNLSLMGREYRASKNLIKIDISCQLEGDTLLNKVLFFTGCLVLDDGKRCRKVLPVS